MKVTRVIELARVPYSDLKDGDEYAASVGDGMGKTRIKGSEDRERRCYPPPNGWLCLPMDKVAYPPLSVTYTISGIEDEYLWNAVGEIGHLPLDWFDEDNIEEVFV